MAPPDGARLPELAGLAEAEEFFEALGVPYDPAVLAARRLQVLRRFRLAVEALLRGDPEAPAAERRAALRRALGDAHATYASGEARSAFPIPGALVRLGRL